MWRARAGPGGVYYHQATGQRFLEEDTSWYEQERGKGNGANMIIYPGLVASDTLLVDDQCHWKVWLWETKEDLKWWADAYAVGPPGKYEDTIALHSPAPSVIIDRSGQFLGNIHFVTGEWNMEQVAHEMLHGMFHYIRCFVPDFTRALYCHWMDDEEELCYPFGEWVEWLYRWLWKKDPNPRWTKDKGEES